jgi:hypothetical protein
MITSGSSQKERSEHANFEDRFPVKAAFGLEDRETFLRRALHGYSAANHLNSVTKSGEKMLSVDTEYLRYYVKPRLESLSLSLRRQYSSQSLGGQ